MKLPKIGRLFALLCLAALCLTACAELNLILCPGCEKLVEPTGHAAVCGVKGHYFCDNLGHSALCEVCEAPLCDGAHGEGICAALPEAGDAALSAMVSGSVLSSDTTLHAFTGEFSDGTFAELRDPNVRRLVYTTAESVYVSAEPSDENALITGDLGWLYLHEGENRFGIRCTAEDGSDSYYRFIIYREAEELPLASFTPAF